MSLFQVEVALPCSKILLPVQIYGAVLSGTAASDIVFGTGCREFRGQLDFQAGGPDEEESHLFLRHALERLRSGFGNLPLHME